MVFRTAKRVVIFVIGFTVLLIGVVLVVMPGPAIIVIPLGLAILGTEFAWARRWLRRFKDASTSAFSTFRSMGSRKSKVEQSGGTNGI